METFRIGEAVRFGWEKFKSHFFFLWTVLAIAWAVSAFFGLLDKSVDSGLADLVIMLVSIFAGFVLQLGLIRAYLDLVDQDAEDKLEVLFSQYRLFWHYFFASILYGLIVAFGLILLIVPGIYFALKYQFFSYLIVDKNLGVFDALKQSGEMTKDMKWKLLGFAFALFGLNLLGLLALGIGLLVTVPVSIVAYVSVYRALSRRLSSPIPAAEPVAAPTN